MVLERGRSGEGEKMEDEKWRKDEEEQEQEENEKAMRAGCGMAWMLRVALLPAAALPAIRFKGFPARAGSQPAEPAPLRLRVQCEG